MIKALIVLSLAMLTTANLVLRRDWEDNNKGYSQSDDYSQPIPYSYGYDVKDDHGLELTRKETGDGHGSVKGSYSYRDDKGIERLVEYVADKGGFRAVVKTNEPGTAKSNPADVEMLADPIIVESKSWGQSDNRGKLGGLW